MTPNLASPFDAIRVFATLCRRAPDASPLDFPDVRRVNSAYAYDLAAQQMRDALALPPPPSLTSLQRFAAPDLAGQTLELLSRGGAVTEAPSSWLRCGLQTVPPPGCRVERCIIGRGVKFGEKCNAFDSVIMDGADIGAGTTLSKCVVGSRCTVRAGARFEKLMLTWSGEISLTKQNVK